MVLTKRRQSLDDRQANDVMMTLWAGEEEEEGSPLESGK